MSLNPLSSSNSNALSKSDGSISSQSNDVQWDALQKRAKGYREIVVARMKESLSGRSSLDLSDLSIKPLLPDEELIVNENVLREYFNYTFENSDLDGIASDFVDKFMEHFFDEAWTNEVNNERYDYIRKDIFNHFQLGLYRDPSSWIDFYDEVLDEFVSKCDSIRENVTRYLIRFIEQNEFKEGDKFNQLKDKLNLCIEDEFGVVAKRNAEKCIESARDEESEESENE